MIKRRGYKPPKKIKVYIIADTHNPQNPIVSATP